MRNSNILFLVALVILAWFGSEVFTAQEICATSCISLTGLPVWGQAVSVVALPVLLVIGGAKARKTENADPQPKPSQDSS